MAILTQVVVRPAAVALWVKGDINGRPVRRRINDFPNSGTFISVARMSARAGLVEGQKGCSVHTGMASSAYRVSVTVVAFSPSDRFLFRLTKGGMMTITLVANTMTYVSGSCEIETEPTRDYASDSSPPMVWPLIGSFPIVRPGIFVPPIVATKGLINAFSRLQP